MLIRVDLQSGDPLEEQIRAQIRELIALGELSEGQPLPSTRQLAADLTIHFNTVARAYRRLEDEGLLVIGQGRGVFVRKVSSPPKPSARATRDALSSRLRQIFVDARLIGWSAAQTQDFVLAELEHFTSKEKRQ